MNSASLLSSEAVTTPPRAVAPAWHTAVIVLLLLGFSYLGAQVQKVPSYGRVGQYFLVIVMELVVAAFIWYGVTRRGIRMADLVGGAWSRPAQFFRDLGIGVAFILIFGGAVLNGLGYLLKASPPAAMRSMMPQSRGEIMVWILMSLIAGFCEELIFRGYLQRQFAALTQGVLGGIVLQGIVFGLGHGYQGWKLMSLIAFYGVLFGWLAHWRRSLRPGMLGHFLQDAAGGILARYLG